MTNEKQFELSLDEVVPRLRSELRSMRGAANRSELKDIDSDTAFELGYESCIHDLLRLTGKDPVELGLIVYYNEGEPDGDR